MKRSSLFWLCGAAALAAPGLFMACTSKDSVLSEGAASSGAGAGMPDASTGSSIDSGPVVGQLDGGPDSNLPALPMLTNVVATEREDSVGIDFDPVDDAVDYRVYPLPADGDVTVNPNGSLTIKNAIYRCAGLRQTFDIPNQLNSTTTNGETSALDAGYALGGGEYPPEMATLADSPTVGYVYVTAGAGRVPVYAIGVHPTINEEGWRESRPKIYTTDATVRQMLLAQGGRDDRIAFYVPMSADAGTQTIHHSEKTADVGYTAYSEFYFGDADVAAHMGDTTPPTSAFQVLKASAEGAVPLMQVAYQATQNHTELSVGKERYKRAANQGPGPLWHLEWAGITAPTTLVVEALASGCPYQGFLSPEAVNAPPHQPLMTLAQIQAASKTTEVFINGEYDLPGATSMNLVTSDAGSPWLATPDESPVPVARSFIQVAPQPHDPSAWDWYEGFNVGTSFGALTPAPDPSSCSCQSQSSPPCNSGSGACGYWSSSTLDVGMYEVDNPNDVSLFATGQFLGQFWDAFDDWAQDVTATVRFTSPKQANVVADPTKFLHVTWSVTSVGTDRRYPQLILSDAPPPVQDGFKNPDSNFLLIQTIVGPSPRLQVEAFHGLFNGSPWAVNNQAPYHALIDFDSGTASTSPAEATFEHTGMDRMTKYDAYISSAELYVFMDGAPAGCTKYPSNGFALNGALSVTFGDVFYHEGAPDELVCYQARPFSFLHAHQCTETKRQWDDLGFKSGVDAPSWDTTQFPCADY